MQPDRNGTLHQTLELKLDRCGRLVDSPLNRFEIRGTVIINDRVYQGVLLEGKADGLRGGRRTTVRLLKNGGIRPKHAD